MNLPSIITMGTMISIGAVVLAVIQFIKEPIPEKLVPYCSVLVGIGVSYLFFYTPGGPQTDFVVVIANGVLGAVFADSGYNFLSGNQSKPLSLSSKTDKPIEVKPTV